MDGLLVIDKPVGPTSHDVVARVRRILGERRIGHTGTLDPLATGVLPLVVGRATRLARFLSACDKTYEAEVTLGFATDTGDERDARSAGRTPVRCRSRAQSNAALEPVPRALSAAAARVLGKEDRRRAQLRARPAEPRLVTPTRPPAPR